MTTQSVKQERIPAKELMVCLFCGGQACLYVHELAGVPEMEPAWQVECTECGATGPSCNDPFRAESWWNGELLTKAIEEREADRRYDGSG